MSILGSDGVELANLLVLHVLSCNYIKSGILKSDYVFNIFRKLSMTK